MAYSFAELESFWRGAGGPADVAPTMAGIGLAESRGRNIVQKGEPYDETGWGIWQITPGDSEPGIGVNRALLNPRTNARAAVAKYRSQGLGAWSTYSSGAYLAFMPRGTSSSSPGGSRPRPNGGGGGGILGAVGGIAGDVGSAVVSAGSGDPLGAAGDVLGIFGGAGSGILGFLKAAVWLVSPLNWLRMVEALLGFALILIGLGLAAKADEELARGGTVGLARQAFGGG